MSALDGARRNRPDWHLFAACRGLGGDLFFSRYEDDVSRAAAVCTGCPVREDCLDAGRREAAGVWGGVPREPPRPRPPARPAERRPPPPGSACVDCGGQVPRAGRLRCGTCVGARRPK